MTRFEDYKHAFPNLRLERGPDGVLEMTIHRYGGQAPFDSEPGGVHDQFGEACYRIGRDPENKVVLLSHAGPCLFDSIAAQHHGPVTAERWDRLMKEGKDLLVNLLAIDIPVIGAMRGDCFIHAELVIMSDIVLAGDDLRLADKSHTCLGVAPSDGVHVVWTDLLGMNRGRHFLLTGAVIEAPEALQLGLVAEVVPNADLLARARTVARDLAQRPRLTLRYARVAMTREWKRRLAADLGYGLALEGLSAISLTNR